MRGASAIVTFAGLDAVDAKVWASRGAWTMFACGRAGSLPDLPLARRWLTFRWTEAGSRTTGDPLGGVWRITLSSGPIALGVTGPKGSSTPETAAPEHRVRNAGHSLGIPDVLMLTLAEYRIGIRPKGAQGTRRSARPL